MRRLRGIDVIKLFEGVEYVIEAVFHQGLELRCVSKTLVQRPPISEACATMLAPFLKPFSGRLKTSVLRTRPAAVEYRLEQRPAPDGFHVQNPWYSVLLFGHGTCDNAKACMRHKRA